MGSEFSRQIEHIGWFALAPLFRWVPALPAGILAFLGVIYAICFPHGLLPGTFREADEQRGYSAGKISYAAALLILIVLFRNCLHVAAGAWAMLALGDGISTLVGKAYGRRRIPWNRGKTWLGSLACFLASVLGAVPIVLWVAHGRVGADVSLGQAVRACCWASAAAAVVETLPGRYLQDNLTIPITGGIVLYLLL